MRSPTPDTPIRLAACECLTALGGTRETHAALLRGETALRATPVLGREGGDLVPLALLPDRAGVLDEQAPPAWLAPLRAFLAPVSGPAWGTARRPVCVTSSNFGVGSLYAWRRENNAAHAHAPHGSVHGSVAMLREACGWGDNITLFSHACVSAHLGLMHAARLLEASAGHAGNAGSLARENAREHAGADACEFRGQAARAPDIEEVLVVSYDFVSPFVAGGFHSLKILNTDFPAPYMNRATGSIGLGDGAAYAILARDRGDFEIAAQSLHNEMYHPTANNPDGSGFAAVLAPIARAAADANLRVWFKGHGTGTLDAGRLEAAAIAVAFPDAPLTGWKGALGHTLGSCGLVELALAAASMRAGLAPATIGTTAPAFTPAVALAPIDTTRHDAVVCASNAFGGAHAAMLVKSLKA